MLSRARLALPRVRAQQVLRLSAAAQPPPQLDGERLIELKLRERFAPSSLQVQDISGGCGTFYAISVTSAAFKDLSIVKQHRLVNEVLKDEIKDIHGLQVRWLVRLSR
ncbi:bola-like protein [Auricularia subglabra TFB-10046 SS5]|nr:bola-like protein [Auricularia subglabra TFB-10046 SS5]